MIDVQLEGALAALREQEIDLLEDAARTIETLGAEGADDARRLQDAIRDLRTMFYLLVVVGEFSAGKSTFVNALIGDDLLPMGITPTTAAIEVVRYDAEGSADPVEELGAVREWRHPNTLGESVAIVDTPGTGSVFKRHERIALDFLHRSDLVIFMLSAKRAFAETERYYMELARQYGKKVVIVINQVDLLDGEERHEVYNFVQEQVREQLGLQPPIFMVSSKRMLHARLNGARKIGWGFEEVMAYLDDLFSEVPPAQQKLITPLDMAASFAQKHHAQIDTHYRLIGDDAAQADQIRHELDRQAESIDEERDRTLEQIDSAFDDIRRRGLRFIDETMRVGKLVSSITDRPSKEELREQFEREVLGHSAAQISVLSSAYFNAVVDGSRAYWRSLIDRLKSLESALIEEGVSLDPGAYAEQRAALQDAIRKADRQLQSYSEGDAVQELRSMFTGNLQRSVGGAALAGVGGVLLLAEILTPAAAVLTGLGVVLAPLAFIGGSAAAALYYRKASRDAKAKFRAQVDELEDAYKRSLVEMTERERSNLLNYGRQVLAPVESRLRTLSARYEAQIAELKQLSGRVDAVRDRVKALKVSPEDQQ